MNITLFDALQGTLKGPDRWQIQRFLCAHAIMLALEGVPAIYIHSLLGTQNFYQGVEHTSQNRTINRYKWDEEELNQLLSTDSHHKEVFDGIRELMAIRREQSCFHPNAEQYLLHISDEIFGFWRQNIQRTERVFCLFNVSSQPQTLDMTCLNLHADHPWRDLISGQVFTDVFGSMQLSPYQSIWLKSCPS